MNLRAKDTSSSDTAHTIDCFSSHKLSPRKAKSQTKVCDGLGATCQVGQMLRLGHRPWSSGLPPAGVASGHKASIWTTAQNMRHHCGKLLQFPTGVCAQLAFAPSCLMQRSCLCLVALSPIPDLVKVCSPSRCVAFSCDLQSLLQSLIERFHTARSGDATCNCS